MKKIPLILVALSLALAACTATPASSTTITVTETDFLFTPRVLIVPLGQPVTITFENNGKILHDFAIVEIDAQDIVGNTSDETASGHSGHSSEFSIHVSTPAGGSNTIAFTPQKAGEYQFICTVEGHQEAGMIGTLIVVAAE